MRLATLFKRLLGMERERVVGVELVEQAGGQVVVVEVARPKRRRMFCSGCGQRIAAAYDRRVVARWSGTLSTSTQRRDPPGPSTSPTSGGEPGDHPRGPERQPPRFLRRDLGSWRLLSLSMS